MLALQSFPFHYEMVHHLFAMGKPILWALPLQEADKVGVLNFYATLARNQNIQLHFMDFHHLPLDELLKAEKIVLLTDDDTQAVGKIDSIASLWQKTFILNHMDVCRSPLLSRHPIECKSAHTAFVHQWSKPKSEPPWFITCSNLISPTVKFAENTNHINKIVVGIIGTMNGTQAELQHMVQRIVHGTQQEVNFILVSRIKMYEPCHDKWTQYLNVSEPELFSLTRMCTHILRTRSVKPSGTLALSMSLCIPMIRPASILMDEGLVGIGYDEHTSAPIALSMPGMELLNQLSKIRQQFMDQQVQFYFGTSATHLQVANLEPMLAPPLKSNIPRIMHHVWLSSNPFMNHIPLKYKKAIHDKMTKHPQYVHRVWTNDSALAFMHTRCPQYIAKFNSCAWKISMADFFRMIVMFFHGGLYSDLDFTVLEPDIILEMNRDLVLFEELPEHCKAQPQLFNGILAAKPCHPFIKSWIENMCNKDLSQIKQGMDVMKTTGPIQFYEFWNSQAEKPLVQKGSQVMPFTNKMELTEDIETEKPVLAFTKWHEGSNWASGKACFQDEIKLDDKTVFVSAEGMCFSNAELQDISKKMFENQNEIIVVSLLSIVSFLLILAVVWCFLRPRQ